MGNLKKGIFGLVAFIMVMFVASVNVSAKEFSEILTEITSADGYTINAGDEEITFGGEEWIGANGRITINSGSAVLKLETGRINITFNGEATINTGKQFIMQIDMGSGQVYPVTLTITDTSVLNVEGNLAIPSGTEGVLVNAGTINVLGNLEIRKDGKLDSTGTVNVSGKLAVYGDTEDVIGTSKINLLENGNVYSNVDLTDNLVIAANKVDGFTWNVVDNTKEYTSFTDTVGTVEFTYGYKLENVEDPVIVPEEPTTEPTEPVEPSEPTEPETPVEDVENPSTLDNVELFMGLGVLSVIGLCATAVVLKKRHN